MVNNREVISQELEKYKGNENRIKRFNDKFLQILKDNYAEIEYVGSLFDKKVITDENGISKEDMVLNYTRLTNEMDRSGRDLGYFDKEIGTFKELPSKEFLLLAIAALGMKEHMQEVMDAAGYTMYMKNLNEYIISVGLQNDIPLDMIRNKLVDYGYRDEAAIDTDMYFGMNNTDNARNFYDIFKKYCELKKVKERDVVEDAGLYSIQYDASRNRYYYQAFIGESETTFHLSNNQCLRVFTALSLDIGEKIEFAKALVENHLLCEDEEKYIFDLINDGEVGYEESVQVEKILTANDVSVRTRVINNSLDYTSWSEMDGFIRSNFGDIRSFAMFFEDVLELEGINALGFIKRTGLAKTSIYDYKRGLGIPEFSRLTVIASLFSQLNQSIYFNLLKKAGKFEFDERAESPLVAIMKKLIEGKEGESLLFGALFDALEMVIEEHRELANTYEEIYKAYSYQCETMARYVVRILKKMKKAIRLKGSLKRLANNKYADLFSDEMSKCLRDSLSKEEILLVCKDLQAVYSFESNHKLIRSMKGN